MDRVLHLMVKIGLTIVAISLCVFLGRICYNMQQETKLKESAYAGEIINKEIENARHGLFASSDSEYRIYIEFEYTYNDEKKTGEKYFTVDKETYLAYDIGDWFDSHNFKK